MTMHQSQHNRCCIICSGMLFTIIPVLSLHSRQRQRPGVMIMDLTPVIIMDPQNTVLRARRQATKPRNTWATLMHSFKLGALS